MPARWFWPHVQMMSRLQAEFALGRIAEISAGTGAMAKADQRSYRAQLRRAAEDPTLRGHKPTNVAQLAALGIKVQEVS